MKKVEVTDTAISGVNIVPVIGVTLVLLVILIVMSPVMNLPNMDVDVPEAVTKETKGENITVSLDVNGRVSIDAEIVDTWENLPAKIKGALQGREENPVIIIRADKKLSYGEVEKLLNLVTRSAEGCAVALATKQRKESLGVESK